MKNHQSGFGLIGMILFVVVAGITVFAGWYVWDKQVSNKNSTTTSKSGNLYNFEGLGISMELLPGWGVASTPTVEEGSNFYNWHIEKNGVNGSISLLSSGFRGGFETCNPQKVEILDKAPTKNSNLTFLYWRATVQNEGPASEKIEDSISVVDSNQKYFGTSYSNDELLGEVNTSGLQIGNYYLCGNGPKPGSSLGLNKEPSPGFARRDTISAVVNTADNSSLKELQSYKDIRIMLTSIK